MTKRRRFHARWHRRHTPIFWWLERRAYVHFIVRELTSLAVAYAAVLLVVQVAVLGAGEAAYDRFRSALASPWVVGWHALVLVGLLYHALTWLHLAPKAMVVKLAGRRLPNGAVLAGHYLGWIAASALVVLLLARS